MQLRQRPTYDEVMGYEENKQPKIKYPNRLATQILDTPHSNESVLKNERCQYGFTTRKYIKGTIIIIRIRKSRHIKKRV